MHIVVAPYKDPALGLDWPEQTPLILQEIETTLEGFDKKYDYKLLESDHGKGASWPTITIIILNAFFLIPAIHKKIRETISEWKRIHAEIIRLVEWLSAKFRIVFYPEELLLLDALAVLEERTDPNELELLDVYGCSKAYDGMVCHKDLKLVIFTFRATDRIIQIAFNNKRELLFINFIDLNS